MNHCVVCDAFHVTRTSSDLLAVFSANRGVTFWWLFYIFWQNEWGYFTMTPPLQPLKSKTEYVGSCASQLPVLICKVLKEEPCEQQM